MLWPTFKVWSPHTDFTFMYFILKLHWMVATQTLVIYKLIGLQGSTNFGQRKENEVAGYVVVYSSF